MGGFLVFMVCTALSDVVVTELIYWFEQVVLLYLLAGKVYHASHRQRTQHLCLCLSILTWPAPLQRQHLLVHHLLLFTPVI